MSLVNRTKELGYLDHRYQGHRAEFVVLYGRRRVGKTALVYHWVQDKPHLFFFATPGATGEQLLTEFSRLVNRALGKPESSRPLGSWEDAFRAMGYLARAGRYTIVLDEFPALAQAVPALAGILQKVWDLELQHLPGLFLILTGSLLSVIRRDVLDNNAPLFRRHTWAYHLKPMWVTDLGGFFPDASPDQLVEIYSVVGGVPQYLIAFRPDADLMTNVREVIASPQGSLFNEAPLQLHQELGPKDVATYLRVLTAIAEGNHTRKAIAAAAAIGDLHAADHYLAMLQDIDLVERRKPLSRLRTRQRWGTYHLKDPFFRFWHKFIKPAQPRLEVGVGLDELMATIRRQLPYVISPVWEEIARRYLLQVGGEGGIPPLEAVGSWHSSSYTGVRRGVQIDIVGVNWRERVVVFGECKWGVDNRVTDKTLEKLMDAGMAWLRGAETRWEIHYAIFAQAFGRVWEVAQEEPDAHFFRPEDVLALR